MKTIRDTNDTLRAIAELAILPFRSNATRQDDGTWLIPVDDEVRQRIEDKRLPAEGPRWHTDSHPQGVPGLKPINRFSANINRASSAEPDQRMSRVSAKAASELDLIGRTAR